MKLYRKDVWVTKDGREFECVDDAIFREQTCALEKFLTSSSFEFSVALSDAEELAEAILRSFQDILVIYNSDFREK